MANAFCAVETYKHTQDLNSYTGATNQLIEKKNIKIKIKIHLRVICVLQAKLTIRKTKFDKFTMIYPCSPSKIAINFIQEKLHILFNRELM